MPTMFTAEDLALMQRGAGGVRSEAALAIRASVSDAAAVRRSPGLSAASCRSRRPGRAHVERLAVTAAGAMPRPEPPRSRGGAATARPTRSSRWSSAARVPRKATGRTASRIDVILDMQRLNRILAHEHGDMTATIEAGASLRDVNVALALHGQMLPLDPPFADRATIGGLLATNDSGPLRHRYGTPRDLVIGVQLATTDGALAKAGGQVVKNVAGYDLSKLMTGSFGSLAAIVSATFKLAPRPAASKTMRFGVRDGEALSATRSHDDGEPAGAGGV